MDHLMKANEVADIRKLRASGRGKKTPIERIFEKYVGRKMMPSERVALQLRSELEWTKQPAAR
jgi:hypothetical protein